MIQTTRFKFSWVLIDELAVGPAPRNRQHVELLVNAGIKSILSLCSEAEVQLPELPHELIHRRVVLPDHTYGRDPTFEEIRSALYELKYLKSMGSVYVHCKAGIERSPLICMAWIAIEKNLSFQSSLDYLMQVHPGTNPLASHLMTIKELLINEVTCQ